MAEKIKRFFMPGKFEKYWPMTEGGPHDKGEEVFKCKDCGAVSYPDEGWDGEPDTHECSKKCQDNHGDWNPGHVSDPYRNNYEKIFPDAPGAGM
jgi:hypothetical protein